MRAGRKELSDTCCLKTMLGEAHGSTKSSPTRTDNDRIKLVVDCHIAISMS